jgi:hypothetical protein
VRSVLLSLVLLSLSLSGAEAARQKGRSGERPKVTRRVASKRGSGKPKGNLARRHTEVTVHKTGLRGGDMAMAAIARSPGLEHAPIADSYIRGILFFGDPAPSFKNSKAQRAILKLARAQKGTHDGTFELRDPTTRKLVGYYSQISTGPTRGLHVFHDPRGQRVATTPYSY